MWICWTHLHRWDVYIFWHAIILAVAKAWLLYKRDCNAHKLPVKDIMKKRLYQALLASSLILVRMRLCYFTVYYIISIEIHVDMYLN